jgi:hypothetical protein
MTPVPGPAAQHAVSELLRRAEYHRADPGLVQRIWGWLLDRLDALFGGSAGGNALLVLLVLVAALVIVAIVRAGPPRRAAAGRAGGDPLAPLAAIDHYALAQRLTAAGDLRAALREWLRAAVQLLEARGLLLPRPGRTGAGAAREAAALLPTAAAELARAAAAFDEVWFGGRAATRDDVAAAQRAAETVRRARVAVPAGDSPVPR